MKNFYLKIWLAAFLFIFALQLPFTVVAASNISSPLTDPAESVRRLYQSKRDLSDWEALLLGLNGLDIRAPLFSTPYFRRVEREILNANGVYRLATDYARIILVYKSFGKNPADIAGFNFIEMLKNFENMQRQGLNAYLWTLIAFYGQDSSYTLPLTADILKYQRSDGGFSLTLLETAKSDIDLTAMAVTALAPYANGENETICAAVERALEFLSVSQNSDGTFSSAFGSVNSESLSQVIIALCAAGVDIYTDSRFIKNELTLPDVLDGFRLPNGQYARIPAANGAPLTANSISTQQAFLALTALKQLDLYSSNKDTPDTATVRRGIFEIN